MFGERPVRLLVKLPVPLPLLVLLSPVVGLPPVFQQTPRAVTDVPPSEVTLPPQDAVVVVMELTLATVTAGVVEPEQTLLGTGTVIVFESLWSAEFFALTK